MSVRCAATPLKIPFQSAAEEEYAREHSDTPTSPKGPISPKYGTSPSTKSNVWQNTFNPG